MALTECKSNNEQRRHADSPFAFSFPDQPTQFAYSCPPFASAKYRPTRKMYCLLHIQACGSPETTAVFKANCKTLHLNPVNTELNKLGTRSSGQLCSVSLGFKSNLAPHPDRLISSLGYRFLQSAEEQYKTAPQCNIPSVLSAPRSPNPHLTSSQLLSSYQRDSLPSLMLT